MRFLHAKIKKKFPKGNISKYLQRIIPKKVSQARNPGRRAWVRGQPSETLPCTLMPSGACKIFRLFNVP